MIGDIARAKLFKQIKLSIQHLENQVAQMEYACDISTKIPSEDWRHLKPTGAQRKFLVRNGISYDPRSTRGELQELIRKTVEQFK